MPLSTVTITFGADVPLEEYVCIKVVSTVQPSLFTEWHERYKAERIAPFTAQNFTTGIPGEGAAIGWHKSFNADYNPIKPDGTRHWLITRVDNALSITAPDDKTEFSDTGLQHPQSSVIDVDIFNPGAGALILVDTVEFLPATSQPVCTHYKVRVTTTNTASHIMGPPEATEIGNTDNPFEFESLRGFPLSIQIGNADGITDTENFGINQVPQIFTAAGIALNISQTPTGATVSVNIVSPTTGPQTYTYSLDDITYGASNVFPGLANGDYTIYVKDSYGCMNQLDFTVSDGNVVNPYSYISKSMSFRFALRETLTEEGPYRNDENSLSCESFAADEELAYREDQQFISKDVIVTQIKSAHTTVTAKVIKADDSEDTLVVSKKTNNIGLTDARDATVYNIGGNQSGVYFTTGNYYNFDTDIDTGEDYILNGGLPEWGVIGNYVKVGAAWFQILNVIFDESINAEVLVIDSIYTGVPYSAIAKCQFNRQAYEVYEFTTIMLGYLDSKIRVQIDETDANFDDREMITEYLDIQESHAGTLKIEYYNETNSDVFYRTGIRNVIRIPIDLISGDHDDDSSEILKSDTRSDLISSEVYELDEFTFHPVTKEIYRKIVLALSHEYVIIDGVSYVKNGGISKEGPLEDSNLYVVKAKMLKTIAPFVTNVYGSESDIIANEEILEVPNLVITGDDDFISQ